MIFEWKFHDKYSVIIMKPEQIKLIQSGVFSRGVFISVLFNFKKDWIG